MASLKKLCTSCKITKSFNLGSIPAKYNYKSVSNMSNNIILKEIMENSAKFKVKEKFIILADGSRYGIEVCTVSKQKIIAKQYFLHYDGTRGKLIAVNVRFVEVVF
jgi:hypothetical protein